MKGLAGVVSVAAVSVVLVAGCSSGSSSNASATSTSSPDRSAAGTVRSPAAGCASSRASGTRTVSVSSGGRSRTVIVHVPTSYSLRTPAALVMNLHGSGSTAAGQEAFSGMDATADADGFVVAYPQGAIRQGAGYSWNVPGEPLLGGRPAPANAPDDVAFLSRLMTVLEQRYCIDTHRIDVTGFSGGARTASQLGCDLSDRVAAIAPVSGLRIPKPCHGTRPMPVVAFHGTADPVDPYNGNGQPYWVYSVPQATEAWATHDHCRTAPKSSTPVAGAELVTYTGCGGGAVVELYTLEGVGHRWPGGPPVSNMLQKLLGPGFDAVNANDAMWTFFQEHPLR